MAFQQGDSQGPFSGPSLSASDPAQQQSTLPLQVDNFSEHDDTEDEGLGEDNISETVTLASTILRNREEWGRTYHKFRGGENDYWGPNDDQQNDQLDLGHHMLTLLLDNRLYSIPLDVSKCRRVLDVGCGTGIWAMDFADSHPEAEVLGVDLSPIQPAWTPSNCSFVIDDVEEEWVYPSGAFDFVHIRCMMGSIKDWPHMYQQAFENLNPGGWIQHMDMAIEFKSDDDTVPSDHIMARWSKTFVDCGENLGKTFKITERAAPLMREAGFEDVQEQWFKLPVGGWAKGKKQKEIGYWNYHYCLSGCEGWALFLLTKVLQWTMEETQVFIAQFRNALNNRNTHAYYLVNVVSGRKPET